MTIYTSHLEAKNTNIFIIKDGSFTSQNRHSIESHRKLRVIEETNLYDFVMKSERLVCSPKGIAPELFIEQIDKETFDVRRWIGGGRSQSITNFSAIEIAEDFIFDVNFNEFLYDDQRDTSHYFSYNEAFEALVEINSEILNVSIETAKSITERYLKFFKSQIDHINGKEFENKNRIYELAKIYSLTIKKIEGEAWKETEKRLSRKIGGRIEKPVFREAVMLVRHPELFKK